MCSSELTAYDAKGLMKRALRSKGPVIMLEHRELWTVKGPVPEEDYENLGTMSSTVTYLTPLLKDATAPVAPA